MKCQCGVHFFPSVTAYREHQRHPKHRALSRQYQQRNRPAAGYLHDLGEKPGDPCRCRTIYPVVP